MVSLPKSVTDTQLYTQAQFMGKRWWSALKSTPPVSAAHKGRSSLVCTSILHQEKKKKSGGISVPIPPCVKHTRESKATNKTRAH